MHHLITRRTLAVALSVLGLLGGAAATATATGHRPSSPLGTSPWTAHFRPRGRLAHYRQQCADPYSGKRSPSNPLDLARAPGSNPLTGARFFVPGPAHGGAAEAIAQLVGLDPATLPSDESWATFAQQLRSGPIAAKLRNDPSLATEVQELSLIAAEPAAQRISSYVMGGGGPGAVFAQTEKILCRNLASDPGTIPLFNTYFLHADLGGCPTPADVIADQPTFMRRVNEMAAAVARRPAVFMLEIDALGSSACVHQTGALPYWEADLRYEMEAMQALPHTVVYVEAGYSDSNSVAYTARALRAIGIDHIRGFFTNDTHDNWTINEVRWANAIAHRVGNPHYIVNTSDNGQGPLIPRDRVKYGNEELCNPPGRGLGPRDTTATGFPLADAFLWVHSPGNSSGSCNGGPPSGTFWPAGAEREAQLANSRLGPGYPSEPY